MLDPGIDLAKTPAESIEVLRAPVRARTAWSGRCCWRFRARTSSAPSPGAARPSAAPGTLAALEPALAAPGADRAGARRGRARRTSSPCGARCWGWTRLDARPLAEGLRRNGSLPRPTLRPQRSRTPLTVLQQSELEKSPLADLHAIASELGVEGFRGLRRDDLVAAIVRAQGGEPAAGGSDDEGDDAATRGRRRTTATTEPRRPARRRYAAAAAAAHAAGEGGRGGGRRTPTPATRQRGAGDLRRTTIATTPTARQVSGVLDVLQGGSGFLRVESGEDVYVSPAQIRRCELRAGRRGGRPAAARAAQRAPPLARARGEGERPRRRAARGAPAVLRPHARAPDRAAARARRRSRPCPTARARAWPWPAAPAPGDHAAAAGDHRLGREGGGDLSVALVLVGARPEERHRAGSAPRCAVSGGGFDRPNEAQVQAAELAVERGKRVAERGGDAVVVIDSLAACPPGAARGAVRRGPQGRGGRIAHGDRRHRQGLGAPAPGEHANRAGGAGRRRLPAGVGRPLGRTAPGPAELSPPGHR